MHSYYFTGARIEHMLLMSWVGEKATRDTAPNLEVEVTQALQAALREGVVHNDEHGANLLWSEERRCVMLVDFDRADLLPLRKRTKILPNKRKARDDDSEIFSRKYDFSGQAHIFA
ncbi:Serine/threonine-protein kinase Kist [Madurella mycetomatis]|uniref:Serine/threonine-protein kinase Kist n=1 Tax=Madurella mycetomatis TaxID=100816 RepID=A0A175VPU0_9PEZI|nr:Serine/threonine-protein kinase Kist [Madurella mycetomatis]